MNDELHFDIIPKKMNKYIDVFHKKVKFETDYSVMPIE